MYMGFTNIPGPLAGALSASVAIAPGMMCVVPPSPALAAGGMADTTIAAIAVASRHIDADGLVVFM